MALMDDTTLGAGSPDAGTDSIGASIEGEIAELAAEVEDLTNGELDDAVKRIELLRRKLEAVELRAVRRFDISMEWSANGYKHPTAAIKERCQLPRAVAGRKVRTARSLELMPRTAESFAAGRISLAHVDVLAKANTPRRREFFAEGEHLLVTNAERFQFADFVETVEYFKQQVDEQLGDDDGDPPDIEGRECFSTKLGDGTGKVDATLDKVGFTEFDTVLRKIEKELFEADHAALIAEHGEGAPVSLMARTPKKRRADALVEMAKRAVTAPANGKRPLPLVIVLVDHNTFESELKRRLAGDTPDPAGWTPTMGSTRTCELLDGTVITPGEAVALAIEGHVQRMVYDAPDENVRIGRKQRFFTGALKTLIQARDRHCTGPGCDAPHWECDIDHIIDWQHGGETDPDNGGLKCKWHHRHKDDYDITIDPVTGRARWRKRT